MLLERDIDRYVVHEEAPVVAALRQITANRSRAVFVVTSDGRLVGSLTDGDFRRWVVNTEFPSLEVRCADLAYRGCVSAQDGISSASIEQLFGSGVELVPIVDRQRHIIGIARPRTKEFSISGRALSSADPAFLIAEIGINHNGSLETAKRLVDAAAAAGADCAKFQMRNLSALYRTTNSGLHGEDLGVQYTLDLLAETSLSVDEMFDVFDYTKSVGLIPLCTPWDMPTANLLVDYGMSAFKVASADLTNHELLNHLGQAGFPLILSTGMSTEEEIRETIELIQYLSSPYALLQCNSAYPSPYKDVQLRYMDRLAQLGGCLVGYSGHERGFHIAVAAAARGASIVEKHITLDKTARGNDHVVSLLPAEFKQMVSQIRDVEAALGSDRPRTLTQGEQLNRLSLAKSLVAHTDLEIGHLVSDTDLEVRSPGRGLQPNRRSELIGIRLNRSMTSGDFFFETDLSASSPARQYFFNRPWGIPVRFHDYIELSEKSNPDFLEFHLSYRDLEIQLDQAVPEQLDLGLTVHSPDLFHDDHILDLASDDVAIRNRSIVELQRVIDLTRDLSAKFRPAKNPLVIVSMGGSSLHTQIPVQRRPWLYERVAKAIYLLDSDGIELVAQTLPPFPWYLGGQRHCNLFVDPIETARFSLDHGIRLCLDLSHTKLACTHARSSFSEAIEVLAPHTAHLHLVDAAGSDSEGLQIEEGEIDWSLVGEQLNRLAPRASFIPEIWQGHVGGGQGFWTALDRLERILSS